MQKNMFHKQEEALARLDFLILDFKSKIKVFKSLRDATQITQDKVKLSLFWEKSREHLEVKCSPVFFKYNETLSSHISHTPHFLPRRTSLSSRSLAISLFFLTFALSLCFMLNIFRLPWNSSNSHLDDTQNFSLRKMLYLHFCYKA